MQPIPYSKITTLFFDVGGTLVSINFDLIREELLQFGINADSVQLERAEASARPIVSKKISLLHHKESQSPKAFELYFSAILEQLSLISNQTIDVFRISRTLAPIINPPGKSNLLWSSVLPGVREALSNFAGMGFKMAAISNSDGTVENSLVEMEIRKYFNLVVDSHILGISKPNAGIFLYAIETLSVDPKQVLHTGDMYFADVEGARRAGLHALLLDPFDDWKNIDCERLPDISALHEQFLKFKQRD